MRCYYGAAGNQKNKVNNNIYEKVQDKKHPGKNIERDTFIAKYPPKIEEYTIKAIDYQIGWMARVKQDAVKEAINANYYQFVYVIRLYKILIKNLKK